MEECTPPKEKEPKRIFFAVIMINEIYNGACQLMAALIASGKVKPGSDIEDWNQWCINKAKAIHDAIK